MRLSVSHVSKHPLIANLRVLSLTADSNMAVEDGVDEKGCHCEISVEDLLPSVKSVIRAVRWAGGNETSSFIKLMLCSPATQAACKQTLITPCLLMAPLIECLQYQDDREIYSLFIFRSSLVRVTGYRDEIQEMLLAWALTVRSLIMSQKHTSSLFTDWFHIKSLRKR